MKSRLHIEDSKARARNGKQLNRKPDVADDELVDLIRELLVGKPDARALYEEEMSSEELVLALIKLRRATSVSQKELAERLGMSQQMVSKMENTNYEGRTFSKIWRHANALGFRPVIKFEPIVKWRKKHPITGLADDE